MGVFCSPQEGDTVTDTDGIPFHNKEANVGSFYGTV